MSHRCFVSFMVLVAGIVAIGGTPAFAASDTVTITATKMKYGPKGKNTPMSNQCWTKSNTQEYATCLFPNGIKGGGGNDIIKVEMNSVQMAPAQQQYEK